MIQKIRKKKYSLWVEPGLTGAALREMFKDVYNVFRKHENKSHSSFYIKQADKRMKKRKKRENNK
jgi:hypothetical protein